MLKLFFTDQNDEDSVHYFEKNLNNIKIVYFRYLVSF